MKTNKHEEKYKEIFQEMKDDKMNWDFNDFLAQAEKQEKTIPLVSKIKGTSFPKIFLMAASLILLVALGILFNSLSKTKINEKDNMVKNEILKQKDDFGNGNEIVALQTKDSVNVVSDSLLSDSASVRYDADVVEKILPKRGRIRRSSTPQFVQNSTPEKSAKKQTEKNIDYKSNYVIINGQKIENEQEAIDLTKYSFRILSENVSKTVASTEALNSFNNDY